MLRHHRQAAWWDSFACFCELYSLFPGFSSTKEGLLRLFLTETARGTACFHSWYDGHGGGVWGVFNIRMSASFLPPLLPYFPVCGPVGCVPPTSPQFCISSKLCRSMFTSPPTIFLPVLPLPRPLFLCPCVSWEDEASPIHWEMNGAGHFHIAVCFQNNKKTI